MNVYSAKKKQSWDPLAYQLHNEFTLGVKQPVCKKRSLELSQNNCWTRVTNSSHVTTNNGIQGLLVGNVGWYVRRVLQTIDSSRRPNQRALHRRYGLQSPDLTQPTNEHSVHRTNTSSHTILLFNAQEHNITSRWIISRQLRWSAV